jgi:hypothetical protein
MKITHSLIVPVTALALGLGAGLDLALAQSDNFNSGTDSAWTHQDPIGSYLHSAQVTFSFPVLSAGNDGYRIQSKPSPSPSQLGPSRGGSLREDVTYNTNFYVAVDLVTWQNTNVQAVGTVARVSTPGLGTTCGYLFSYNNASPAAGQGVVGIYRLTDEQYSTISTAAIYLNPTNSYRLAFFGQGTNLQGLVYLLPNTNVPIVTVSGSDSIYATGYCGLAQVDQSSAKTYPTDVTWDNYQATNFCLSEPPQSLTCVTGGVVNLSVAAVGTPPLTFQWLRSSTNLSDAGIISGSASNVLTLAGVSASDAAPYSVIVSDAAGRSATSAVATVTIVNFAHGAPNVAFNFDDGLVPDNTTTYGTAYVDGGLGVLHLTDAANSEQGSFIVNDLNSGALVRNFDVQFDLLLGGSTTSVPADGTSFVWANDLPQASFGEAGAGSGLVVTFEVYGGNSSIPGPGIEVKYGGVVLAQTLLPLSFLQTGANFVPVNIRLDAGGYLSLTYNSQVVYLNLPVPGLANGLAGAQFGWGARTGSDNENQWLDNISITTSPQVLGIVNNGNGTVTVTYTGVLQSSANVADGYADVAGASSPYTFTLSGTGQIFWRARVTTP